MEICYDGLTMKLKSNSVVIAGDWHIPQHSWSLIEQCCNQDCEDLIINGDFFNLDSMSEFAKKQKGCDWETEKVACRSIFNVLLRSFNKVVLLLGNHDKRVSTKTNYAMGLRDLVNLTIPEVFKNKVIVTDNDFVCLNDGVRDWRICHSVEYSKRYGSKAKGIGEKYNASVILGHSHMLSMTEEYKGRGVRYYIDGGCMVDYSKVEYENVCTTTYSNWANGFIKIVNGVVEVVTGEKLRECKVKYDINSSGRFGYSKSLWERER